MTLLEKLLPKNWTPRYWTLFSLLCWGGVILSSGVLRFDAYGIDESAAKALLLSWSVADRVISPVVIFGLPDFRSILFLPVGLYWPGSILAAKVFTLLIMFIGAMFFYRWNKNNSGAESALIATGLLLISPLTLAQIDAIGIGPYLIFTFGLGIWLDQKHRTANKPLGAWYFIQLLLIVFAVSLHPMALAYPIALAIYWYNNPVDEKQQKHAFIGIGLATIFALLLHIGWTHVIWFSNPFGLFINIVIGEWTTDTLRMMIGSVLLGLLVITLLADWKSLTSSLTGLILMISFIIGLTCADETWALLSFLLLVYLGTPRLIRVNAALGKNGFAGQRGIVMVVFSLLAILFMQADKAQYYANAQNQLSPQDRLILTLESMFLDIDEETEILVMSEWPARTMLATKRNVLPLPPSFENSQELMENIKGTTHVMFDKSSEQNKVLGTQLAELSGLTKTLSLQEGGVIMEIKRSSDDKNIPMGHDSLQGIQ
ncbi:MAG: hypothetical protein ACE5EH_02290 [Gammaproteobacteria bacterium]